MPGYRLKKPKLTIQQFKKKKHGYVYVNRGMTITLRETADKYYKAEIKKRIGSFDVLCLNLDNALDVASFAVNDGWHMR